MPRALFWAVRWAAIAGVSRREPRLAAHASFGCGDRDGDGVGVGVGFRSCLVGLSGRCGQTNLTAMFLVCVVQPGTSQTLQSEDITDTLFDPSFGLSME
jgi:hypothetical protein